jgi:branched-chain amino acid transport system ATP-binding protein
MTAARSGLVVRGLRVSYGHVRAVAGIDLSVNAGEILALLGPNGAGKSSVVRGISGVAPSSATEISVNGVSLLGMEPNARARHIAHVPEGRHLFGAQTVRENLLLGAFWVGRRERDQRLASVISLLPELEPHLSRPAVALSGGQQQMVAIGRGLLAATPVLIVDELSLGLAPIIANKLGEALVRLRNQGIAVICVEQHLTLALSIADRVMVLDRGAPTVSGTVDEVAERARDMQDVYLGRDRPDSPP